MKDYLSSVRTVRMTDRTDNPDSVSRGAGGRGQPSPPPASGRPTVRLSDLLKGGQSVRTVDVCGVTCPTEDHVGASANRRSVMVQDADGCDIEIVTVDDDPASPAHIHAALRTLARLLVRQYREKGDPVAMEAEESRSASLTVVTQPSPDEPDEDAA